MTIPRLYLAPGFSTPPVVKMRAASGALVGYAQKVGALDASAPGLRRTPVVAQHPCCPILIAPCSEIEPLVPLEVGWVALGLNYRYLITQIVRYVVLLTYLLSIVRYLPTYNWDKNTTRKSIFCGSRVSRVPNVVIPVYIPLTYIFQVMLTMWIMGEFLCSTFSPQVTSDYAMGYYNL